MAKISESYLKCYSAEDNAGVADQLISRKNHFLKRPGVDYGYFEKI
jgi:hypothetical protein